jgi:methionyl-tRNA formyltransferase
MKIIFAGTTEFGIPTLEKIKAQHELVLIITQPDRPTGRNRTLTPPPIKVWAEKNNIQVQQPEKIQDLRFKIQDLEPDLLLVAAYGQIIPQEVLDIPKFKSINIHGSILPKHRGASPIQSAILNGDTESGITLIQMDAQMDHGPIVATQSVAIEDKETFSTLHKKLSIIAADLITKTLQDWFAGKIQPKEQNHSAATFTKLIKRTDGKIDWSKPAVEVLRKIRALNPEPGTWTTLGNKSIIISDAEIINDHKIELPGKLYVSQGEVAVKTLDQGLLLKKVKPEGKNEMSGKDFLNGLKNLSDKIFI